MPVRINNVADSIQLNTSSLPSASAFSICAWFRTSSSRAGNDRDYFRLSDSGFVNLGVLQEVTTDVTYLYGEASSGTAASAEPSESPWIFAALSCAGSGAGDLNAYLWEDGAGATPTATATDVGISTTIANVLIGSNAFNSWIDGEICFVKVWDDVLSESDFNGERAQGKPVITANLNRYHRMSGSADTADYSGNGRSLTFSGISDGVFSEPVDWETFASGDIFAPRRQTIVIPRVSLA